MTKQEIDGLKIGDIIINNFESSEFKITEILKSEKFDFKIFVGETGNFMYEREIIEDCYLYSIKQQPKKIPYTLETFPKNAVFIKGKCWIEKHKRAFYIKEDCLITCSGTHIFFNEKEQMDFFEIGCQVIKDGKIEIEWKPFYQEV